MSLITPSRPNAGMPEAMSCSDLEVVLAIARAGSLAGAARQLGCTHSTVFRRIHAIEASVGVRFFERLPSGYAMTDAGQVALRYAERIEGEFHSMHREVLGRDTELRGDVRITSMEAVISEILPPLAAEFRRRHPNVTLDLLEGNLPFDLRRRDADVAIRATKKPPDDALGNRICEFRFAYYASPAYLAAHGDRPLEEHDFVMHPHLVDWFVPAVFKSREQLNERVAQWTNAVHAAVNAARAGLGVVLLSCYRMDPIPDLVRVGPTIDRLDMELWILTHPALRHTARVKVLMAFLTEELKKRASLFDGSSVSAR